MQFYSNHFYFKHFSYELNDYHKAILIIRHPLDAAMSEFNHDYSGSLMNEDINKQTSLAHMQLFSKVDFAGLFLKEKLPNWIELHESILNNFTQPILLVQYEKLKTNVIEEMRRVLPFLGFNMTKETESCLKLGFDGNFKRKPRPQEQLYEIYENFTDKQLAEFDEIYQKYLQKLKQFQYNV